MKPNKDRLRQGHSSQTARDGKVRVSWFGGYADFMSRSLSLAQNVPAASVSTALVTG